MLTPTALLWTRVGAGAFLLLIGTQSYGIWRARNQTRSGRNWPTVRGEVTASSVERHSMDADQFAVTLRYRYRVGEKDYEGDRIRIGGKKITSRAHAETMAAKYPPGCKVTVHYDPKKPARAVLEAGKSANTAVTVAVLLLFVAIEAVLASILLNGGELPTTPNGVPWFVFMVLLVPIVLGGACIVHYVQIRQLARTSARWPTVTGRITASRVSSFIERDEDGDETEKFLANVQYAYRVGAANYRGNAVNWGWTSIYADRDNAAAALAKYPADSTVTVYYDPADPDHAVLDPAGRRGRAAPLIAGFFLGGIGVFMTWAFWMIG